MPDKYGWYQDAGISPFTMRQLAGKTIPMWIDDFTGELRRDNPKAQTRTTVDGRIQVLIFRRAAPLGQRKTAMRKRNGKMILVDVPASYPGAPGRITRRIPAQPDTPPGKAGGWIATSNVGVRWRHPGMLAKEFIEYGIITAAAQENIHGIIQVMKGEEIL